MTANPVDILNYIPEGVSVAAVMVTVVLFLKFQREREKAHEAHMDRRDTHFKDTLEAVAKEQSRALDSLGSRMENNTNATSTMNQNLIRLLTLIENDGGRQG